jgi:predicted nicotinamide N-methyase
MSRVRVRYQTYEFGDTDIHVRTLRDRQQFDETDLAAEQQGISSAAWSLFGIVWESGEVLARLMRDYDVTNLRILEVGCGIGLASLVLQSRGADITASDLHPSAGTYLGANAVLNGLTNVPFVQAAWATPNAELGQFDLIIGSDLLYEAWGVDELVQFLERHSAPECTVIMVDPGRGFRGRFRSAMVRLGYRVLSSEPISSMLDPDYRGVLLELQRGSNE